MNIHVYERKEAASYAASQLFLELINTKPDATLGLATGNTPVYLYRYIRELSPRVEQVTTFNLDEYVGIDPLHPASFATFMRTHLFNHLSFLEGRIHLPNPGLDPEAAAKDYQEQLQKHPIDIQLLGIGTNGHIGFNEPGCDFNQGVHIETLSEETRKANASAFESLDVVPTQALTMGIQNIMAAKRIVLLAFGEKKAQAVKKMIEGPITNLHPASILQKHPLVDVFLDQAAASLLKEK
jgi:glucosamine-6-phosphate deaminase